LTKNDAEIRQNKEAQIRVLRKQAICGVKISTKQRQVALLDQQLLRNFLRNPLKGVLPRKSLQLPARSAL